MVKALTKIGIDPMLFISIHLFWLKCFGQTYITESPSTIKYWFKYLFQIIVFLSLIFPITGGSIYLIYHHDDVSKLADGLYLLTTEAFTPIKLVLFYLNKRLIMELMSDLNSDIFKLMQPEHEDLAMVNIKRTRSWSTYYYYVCIFAITVSLFIPIMENFEVHPSNIQFPYVDVMTSPAYQIIYFLQIYYKPSQVLIHCSLETMPSAFMSCAIAQLDILTFNLENLDLIIDRAMLRLVADGKVNDNSAARKKVCKECLRRCIKHHQKILNFVKKIEDTYSSQLGLQFMLGIIIICLIGIKLMSMDDPMHQPVQLVWTSVYFFCMVMNIFTVCFFGNELIWKSDYLSTAMYKGPWISLDEDLKRSIIMFSERCKKPMVVRAAKLFNASMPTFTALMQWSYKAFAVMNTMK